MSGLHCSFIYQHCWRVKKHKLTSIPLGNSSALMSQVVFSSLNSQRVKGNTEADCTPCTLHQKEFTGDFPQMMTEELLKWRGWAEWRLQKKKKPSSDMIVWNAAKWGLIAVQLVFGNEPSSTWMCFTGMTLRRWELNSLFVHMWQRQRWFKRPNQCSFSFLENELSSSFDRWRVIPSFCVPNNTDLHHFDCP